MSPLTSWTFLLFFCLNSIVSSEGCIRLRDNHKDLPDKILNNFQHMIPEEKTSDDCVTDITLPDLCSIYQVDSAAVVVREVFPHILEFYRKHKNQKAWKELQEDMNHLFKLLSGCTTEKPLYDEISRNLSDYLNTLRDIMREQEDAVCAEKIIYENIRSSLQNCLSALQRRQHAK